MKCFLILHTTEWLPFLYSTVWKDIKMILEGSHTWVCLAYTAILIFLLKWYIFSLSAFPCFQCLFHSIAEWKIIRSLYSVFTSALYFHCSFKTYAKDVLRYSNQCSSNKINISEYLEWLLFSLGLSSMTTLPLPNLTFSHIGIMFLSV